MQFERYFYRNDIDLLSKSKAVLLTVLGILLAIAYKFWKYYGRETMGFDPQVDGRSYEIWNTIFRAFNSIGGIGICVLMLPDWRMRFFRNQKLLVGALVGYLLAFAGLKVMTAGSFSFNEEKFIYELFFNFFTGVSEEFVFRGMILFGLWRLIGLVPALGLSSLIFSLWHYDVSVDWLTLLFIGVTGLAYGCAFVGGVGLITLSMVHFLWDQIVYGLVWAEGGGKHFLFLLIILGLVAVIVFTAIAKAEYLKKNQLPK